MSVSSGAVQKELSDIWDSLGTDTPRRAAARKIDDESGQVLAVEFDGIGLIVVHRKPGQLGELLPTVGRKNQFV